MATGLGDADPLADGPWGAPPGSPPKPDLFEDGGELSCFLSSFWTSDEGVDPSSSSCCSSSNTAFYNHGGFAVLRKLLATAPCISSRQHSAPGRTGRHCPDVETP